MSVATTDANKRFERVKIVEQVELGERAEAVELIMELVIEPTGRARMIYSELIDARHLGRPQIGRGSHVEPTADARWTADLSPVGGPLLGPFATRSAALAGELAWLRSYWLGTG